MNLKWRMLITPGAMLRLAGKALVWALCGESLQVQEVEAACPHGLWPKAL